MTNTRKVPLEDLDCEIQERLLIALADGDAGLMDALVEEYHSAPADRETLMRLVLGIHIETSREGVVDTLSRVEVDDALPDASVDFVFPSQTREAILELIKRIEKREIDLADAREAQVENLTDRGHGPRRLRNA